MLTVRKAKRQYRNDMGKAIVIGLFLGVLTICDSLQQEKVIHTKVHHQQAVPVQEEGYTPYMLAIGTGRGPKATPAQAEAIDKYMLAHTPKWCLAQIKHKKSKPDIFSVLASK